MGPLNKVILVTGANGGLGSSVTQAFLAAGARVAGVSPNMRAIPDSNFLAVQASLSDLPAARQAAETVIHKWGRIDALVHLVGAFAGGESVADTDDATLDKMLDLNFRTAFHIFRAVIPHMRTQGSGRILAIGSRVATNPQPMLGVYSASKAALVSLVQTVALENKDRGISANVILPGTMDTPANRAANPGADFSKWVQTEQVAALLVHLAGDQAQNITGAVIPVLGEEL